MQKNRLPSEPKNRRQRRAVKALERKLGRPVTKVLFEYDYEDVSVDRRGVDLGSKSTLWQP